MFSQVLSQVNDSAIKIERGLANYLNGLQHNNDGVVESSIVNLIKMKYYYPQLDYEKIVVCLEKLETSGHTKRIRDIAHVAKTYIKS